MKTTDFSLKALFCLLFFFPFLNILQAQTIRLLPEKYEMLKPLAKDVYRFKKDGKVGLVKAENGNLEEISSWDADYITSFYDSRAIVAKLVDGNCKLEAIIDENFGICSPQCECFVGEYPFYSNDRLLVYTLNKDEKKYGYLDRYGEMCIKANYLEAYPFVNGKAVVKRNKHKTVEINHDGKSPFLKGLLRSHSNIFDTTYPQYANKRDIETCMQTEVYPSPKDHEPVLTHVKDNNRYGYNDKNGKPILPPYLNHASDFCKRMAVVELNGSYRFAEYLPDIKIEFSQSVDMNIPGVSGKSSYIFRVSIPDSAIVDRVIHTVFYDGDEAIDSKMIKENDGQYCSRMVLPTESCQNGVVHLLVGDLTVQVHDLVKATPINVDITMSASRKRIRANSSDKAEVLFTITNHGDKPVTLTLFSSGAKAYLKNTEISVNGNSSASFKAYYSGITSKCTGKITAKFNDMTSCSATVSLVPYL